MEVLGAYSNKAMPVFSIGNCLRKRLQSQSALRTVGADLNSYLEVQGGSRELPVLYVEHLLIDIGARVECADVLDVNGKIKRLMQCRSWHNFHACPQRMIGGAVVRS